jgi:UDP-N-acetylglucosamine pyrophosphorylase
MMPESSIQPVESLPTFEEIRLCFSAMTYALAAKGASASSDLFKQTAVLKLNGGLGTSMGLDKAKSLLKGCLSIPTLTPAVKGDHTFLDIICQQILHQRTSFRAFVKFILMNSFSTSKDTMDFLSSKYPSIASEKGVELLQNKVPKVSNYPPLPS